MRFDPVKFQAHIDAAKAAMAEDKKVRMAGATPEYKKGHHDGQEEGLIKAGMQIMSNIFAGALKEALSDK